MITLLAIFGLFITVKTSDINEIRVQTVRRGDNVTIKCSENLLRDNKDNLVWYKQSFGKVPQYVGRKIKNAYRFNDAFNDGHFHITQDEKIFNINIARTKEEDAATYFCVQILENVMEFISGTLLVFQAEKANHQAPTLTVITSGESDTLQCSVQAITSSCADEQSVYWFKHGSGEFSNTGIIYTHGDSSDQCKKSSEAGFPTQSCSYTLPKSNLGPANAIYYCAVAACGKVLFGNGTKVDGKEKCISESNHWNVIVLTTSNIISGIIIIVLVGVILKNRKGATDSHPSHTNQAEAENDLNYATVSFAKKPSSSRLHTRAKTDQDTYSEVKYSS
ncbi:uncharacterized protein LOC113532202 isoform X2 [Pangasianodon hypophthalmus]|uniref:uncharacterized protein LOC113532202 isoform X2 n=1 Tax=Pangasianodon hypophthalmus TaxID=310915 RepID=UPI00230803C7|nr:uncharacterized protein LOC113532202 isoform X2 [Pangasianodon hypophthalmus]